MYSINRNKICLVGHFGIGKQLCNGQTIKLKNIYNKLVLDGYKVDIIDTHLWKQKPFKLVKQLIYFIKRNDNIVFGLGENGVKIICPIIILISKLYGKRTHYMVIGGWLPNLVRKNKFIKYLCLKTNYIYVESKEMKKKLNNEGINNVSIFYNFKCLDPIDKNDIIDYKNSTYNVCTFSRVIKEKGIEEAIEAVIKVNTKYSKILFRLDIYGEIDEKYRKEFLELMKGVPDYISYKGTVDAESSVTVLKDYYLLLFPTYYKGEGFAGTLIDSLASGVPIIASDWKYNKEIVTKDIGFLVPIDNLVDNISECLVFCANNFGVVKKMREKCLEEYSKYTPNNVIKILYKNLL